MLLAVAAVSQFAELAVQLVVQTVSLGHHGSFGAYTSGTGALDGARWLAC